MTASAKIILSAKELELVCNTDWILTKHTIIQKVYQLYGDLLPQLEKAVNDKPGLPAGINKHSPKISRGENYRLLPYVILDYPRVFAKEEVLAIRTFFWWGHFVSVTLHLAGQFKTAAAGKLHRKLEWLQQQGYYVCVEDTPWQHHFEEDNYLPAAHFSQQQFWDMLQRKAFIKIAKKQPLASWNSIPGFIEKTFAELLDII